MTGFQPIVPSAKPMQDGAGLRANAAWRVDRPVLFGFSLVVVSALLGGVLEPCYAVPMRSAALTLFVLATPAVAQDARPVDVSLFLERRTGCDHWAGEDAYDAARGQAIAAAIEALRCDDLDRDEKRLRRRFAAMPAVRAALDEADLSGE